MTSIEDYMKYLDEEIPAEPRTAARMLAEELIQELDLARKKLDNLKKDKAQETVELIYEMPWTCSIGGGHGEVEDSFSIESISGGTVKYLAMGNDLHACLTEAKAKGWGWK